MPSFETAANVLASGVLTGLVYGLSALGLSVIFGTIRIVNFAHGELMMWGMFVALLAFKWLGLEPLAAVPVVAAVLFACAGFGSGIIAYVALWVIMPYEPVQTTLPDLQPSTPAVRGRGSG